MKAKFGIVMMVLGSVLLASALGLFLMNQREQQQAGEAVDVLMPQIVEVINHRIETPRPTGPESDAPTLPVAVEKEEKSMAVEEIDCYGYIGFVGVPALGLELPVMADWSYKQLKIAPCRYTGDMYDDNLVIMAHNYKRHFGGLKDLRPGDSVTFTDMDGNTVYYEVVATDVLVPTAIEDMTAGEYDLTLFTCTYGGKSRVTVRCDRVEA